jgi:hypothetical protein
MPPEYRFAVMLLGILFHLLPIVEVCIIAGIESLFVEETLSPALPDWGHGISTLVQGPSHSRAIGELRVVHSRPDVVGPFADRQQKAGCSV